MKKLYHGLPGLSTGESPKKPTYPPPEPWVCQNRSIGTRHCRSALKNHRERELIALIFLHKKAIAFFFHDSIVSFFCQSKRRFSHTEEKRLTSKNPIKISTKILTIFINLSQTISPCCVKNSAVYDRNKMGSLLLNSIQKVLRFMVF